MGKGLNRRDYIISAGAVFGTNFLSSCSKAETSSPEPKASIPLIAAAREQTKIQTRYDPTYTRIAYPGGDVAPNIGVCTDVVIRAYRAIGIDLQKLVHEDMKANFNLYPKIWGLRAPDTNIDHRRVPNLMVFFKRFGQTLPISNNAADYNPGDLLTTSIGGRPHISIISDRRGKMGLGDLMVIQNYGFGVNEDDMLFTWPITGHFRYKI